MPNPKKFDVVVSYAEGVFNSFQSVLGNALVNANAGSAQFSIVDGDLHLTNALDPDEVSAVFSGSGLSVDAEGRPSGIVTSAEFFGFEGADSHIADWRTGSLDIGWIFETVAVNAYFFFHPRGAPEFFEELHDGVRMLNRGSGQADIIEVFGPRDVTVGRGGDDTFLMSTSVGRIVGGRGDGDTIDMFRADSGAKINFEKGFIQIDGARTEIKGVEHFSGTDFRDVVRSDGKGHEIRTWNGRDKIIARDNDTVDAGNGADNVYAEGDDMTIGGGNHDDDITVSGNGNHVSGGRGADVIIASGFDNRVEGGAGRDSIQITYGEATVSGGAGQDTFVFRGLFGDVVVDDYEAGEEIIAFEVGVGASVEQRGDDVVIIFTDGSVTLLNTTVAEINLIEG